MNFYIRNLQRIEYAMTNACTGRCKHCSEGDHADCGEHIDQAVAVKVIRLVCQKYRISSLMTFGGEALLYPEIVYAIHKTAAESAIPHRQLITNGYFSRDPAVISDVVHKLQYSGVTEILLSVDSFHQETIPLDPVKYFASCACKLDMNIKLSPAWLVSREDNNPYNRQTRNIIHQFEELEIPIGAGNTVFPSGNALRYLRAYFPNTAASSSPYDEDPTDIRTISFSPNGDVLNSNIYREDILDILESYLPDSHA